MTALETCANCGATLPANHPAGHNYCEKCSAAWQQENNNTSAPGQCANCGATLPSDQPAGHNYCEKCSTAWQRETTSR